MKRTVVRGHTGRLMGGFSLIEMLVVVALISIMVSLMSSLVSGFQRAYTTQRPRLEAVSNASEAMETLTRTIRLAGNNTSLQAIDPGTAVNGVYNSIRIRADWNPANGSLSDMYEDVTFTVSNGTLCKQEPGDSAPVTLCENIGALSFTYYDKNNNLISSPGSSPGQIALVRIRLDTLTSGSSAMTFSTSVKLRKI